MCVCVCVLNNLWHHKFFFSCGPQNFFKARADRPKCFRSRPISSSESNLNHQYCTFKIIFDFERRKSRKASVAFIELSDEEFDETDSQIQRQLFDVTV